MPASRPIHPEDREPCREAVRSFLAWQRARGGAISTYWQERVARGLADAGIQVRLKKVEREPGDD